MRCTGGNLPVDVATFPVTRTPFVRTFHHLLFVGWNLYPTQLLRGYGPGPVL